jgi:hypothetical protein
MKTGLTMSKKNINEPIIYCDSCYSETDSNGECDDCPTTSSVNRKSIESIYPEYKKLFLLKEEGVTWERVK